MRQRAVHPRQTEQRKRHVEERDNEHVEMYCSSFLQPETRNKLSTEYSCILVLRVVNDGTCDVLVHVEEEG